MSNTLTAVTPKLLAQGLIALRQMAVTARLVNRGYESTAGEQGTSIDVPIPSAITAQAVVPDKTPPTTADVAPTSVSIPLDQWYEAPFYLTDKERKEVMNGFIPMQASEAIKSLCNNVDNYILGLYKGIYGFYGTPGTTPLAGGTTDATRIRAVLTKQLAPLDPRHIIMHPDTEANALDLRAFQDMSWTGDPSAIIAGRLNQRLGFNWWMNQNALTHTTGTLSNGTTHTALVNGALTAGVKVMNINSGTLTGTLVPGDIFTFAGHTQTYVVTNAATLTAAANAIAGVTFEPALLVNVADTTVVTVKATHVVNLTFHRDAIAFASRPLEVPDAGLGSIVHSAVDEITGLTLRLEVTREHKRTRFSYDMLYGGKLVRPELAARLAG